MAELNLDINYFDHIKTKRLAERLGRGSEALPIRLWCYVAKHYPETGRLTGHSIQEIEQACGWWGTPGKCFNAMRDVGFIDEDKHGCSVHGWKERSGHLSAFARRARRAAQVRWENERQRKKVDKKSDAQASTSRCSNPTHPTHLPNEPNPPNGGAGGSGGKVAGEGRAGPGSGGVGLHLKRELAKTGLADESDFERMGQVQRRLNSVGINASVVTELMRRKDVTPERVDRELADIRAGPAVEDLGAVLVTRLRANANGHARKRGAR